MMNITSQGEYSLKNPVLDTSGLGISISGNGTALKSGGFSEMMEKNVKAAEASGASQGNKSKKIVIDKTSKLYEQCEALEVFLLKNMINGMRKTIQKSNLIDTGFAGEMYEDMLYDEYAKDFAKNARMGFAEMAYLELTGQRGKVINHKF